MDKKDHITQNNLDAKSGLAALAPACFCGMPAAALAAVAPACFCEMPAAALAADIEDADTIHTHGEYPCSHP